jgi:sortase A
VGHYPGTADFGEKGNSVLLGHRNYVYGHYFRELNKLELGDIIILRKNNDEFIYEVTDSFVVEPAETWVLDSSEEAEITLITCTPIITYTHRLIIKGRLIE